MADRPKPEWVPLFLRCGACWAEWDDWQPSGCFASVWIAHMRKLRCPECGFRRKVVMRASKTDEPEPEGFGT